MVSEEFDNIQTKVTESRNIQVIHAGVLLKRDIPVVKQEKLDQEALFWNDPMTKLKRHAEQMGYRMIDIFKQFDKDNSWEITRAEFVEGVKVGTSNTSYALCRLYHPRRLCIRLHSCFSCFYLRC